MTNAPKFKVRSGAISATVWENTHKYKDGNEYKNVSVDLQRSYKDKEGNWQNTNSMRQRDLAQAILVMQEVQKRLFLSEDGEENSPSPSSQSKEVVLTDAQKQVYEAYINIGIPHDRAL